jgi:AraC-like DNA-binding protein
MRVYTKEHCFLNGFGLHLRHQRMQICEAEHLHEFVEIVYIRSGEGTHGIDGVEYSVRRGSLLFINYKQTHFFRTDTEMELYNILLDPEWISEKLIEPENAFELLTLSAFSEFAQRIGADQPFLNFSGGERSRLERLLDEMLEEQEGKQAGFETVLKAQANILLTVVFRAMAGRSAEQATMGPEFLENLRQRCSEKLTLQELARSCFYNPSYFSRIFKQKFHMSLTEYVTRKRIDNAMRLLCSTTLSVDEISQKTGFVDRSTFYAAFSRITGTTPAQYRSSNRA